MRRKIKALVAVSAFAAALAVAPTLSAHESESSGDSMMGSGMMGQGDMMGMMRQMSAMMEDCNEMMQSMNHDKSSMPGNEVPGTDKTPDSNG